MKTDSGDKLRRQLGRPVLWTLWALKRLFSNYIFARHPQYFDWLRRAYRALVTRLIRRSGLFDTNFYLETNPDVAQSGCDPVAHYVSHGELEGRQPMPLFDVAHYRAQAGGIAGSINCLLHYAWIGKARGISPSPWFDPQFYRSRYPDIGASGVDPVQHYMTKGALEGRSPCARFDGLYYLRNNPDVAGARINPLLHYLRYGRAEGRRAQPETGTEDLSQSEVAELIKPLVPRDDEWPAAHPHPDANGARVDVIVPVYKGRAETLRCLLAVLSAPCNTPFALIVVDDVSPDPELSADLRDLAGRGLLTLLRNEQNRGFVGSVNRGMALHADRDVVLLNSDAEVYGNWLDRLMAVADRHPGAGTLTPLSNNATICSYPRFIHDNPYPLEVDYAQLDRLTAQVNAGVDVETPTAVGFCMYIRRQCLDEVGLFDEKTFGRGYGEENDFCQRAIARGWQNRITAEVFVRHWGAMSFEGEKGERVGQAMRILSRLYPAYHQDVQRFIADDALRSARQRLDWARLVVHRKASNVLVVCHGRGGGTERHVQEDLRRMQAEGHGVFLLRPMIAAPGRAMIAHPLVRNVPNLEGFSLFNIAALTTACRDLGITEIHAHSFVDFVPEAADALCGLARELGARLDIKIHDYEAICPRINLVDERGIYCGEPDPAGCNRCLTTRGSDSGAVDIGPWRERFERALLAADRVIVPDRDVSLRLQRYFSAVKIEVVPHEAVIPLEPRRTVALPPTQPLRVVVVGAISRFKGYDILLRCAEVARRRRLPLQFVLMGYSYDDAALVRAGVEVTGRYDESVAGQVLKDLRPGLVWLPSTWPETYSYTLSLALRSGFAVSAFDLGAIASRLRQAGRADHLMPLSTMHDSDFINSRFLQIRADLQEGDGPPALGTGGASMALPTGGTSAASGAPCKIG